MPLHDLARSWREYKQRLTAQTCVLIVDDEPVVVEVLSEVLEAEGYQIEAVGSAEAALERIKNRRYDLLITDKNLPGKSGLDLIAGVASEGIELPAVLITAYASTESVSEALRHGAMDYIAKPFDELSHVVDRFRTVLDERVDGLMIDKMLDDLAARFAESDSDLSLLVDVWERLGTLREELRTRAAVLFHHNPGSELNVRMLRAVDTANLRAVVVSSREEAIRCANEPDGPLTALIDFDAPKSRRLIDDLHNADPLIEILVIANGARLETALDAVRSGASDFVLPTTEGLEPLAARLTRLIARSNRRRFFLSLMTSVYHASKGVDDGLAESILKVAGPTDRALIEQSAPPASSGAPEQVTRQSAPPTYEDLVPRFDGDPLDSLPLKRSRPKD